MGKWNVKGFCPALATHAQWSSLFTISRPQARHPLLSHQHHHTLRSYIVPKALLKTMNMWFTSSEKPPQPLPSSDEQNALLRALCAALAFEPFSSASSGSKSLESGQEEKEEPAEILHAHAHTLAIGRVTPSMRKIDLEETFYDAVEFHEGDYNDLHLATRSDSSIELIRSGAGSPIPIMEHPHAAYDPPPPPTETPLRFIRAGKNDPEVGRQRYEATLAWREEQGMNTILKEPHEHFELIKEHYPHYYHLKGLKGEYCYYECPPKTNLKALKAAGLQIDDLLRHYAFVTEFGWQYIDRNDFGRSIYIIDLQGIRISDFVGECVDFVKKTASFTGEHYPERAGLIYVINVPSWFKIIWNVVKPLVDEDTLKKVFILRGKKEIFNALSGIMNTR